LIELEPSWHHQGRATSRWFEAPILTVAAQKSMHKYLHIAHLGELPQKVVTKGSGKRRRLKVLAAVRKGYTPFVYVCACSEFTGFEHPEKTFKTVKGTEPSDVCAEEYCFVLRKMLAHFSQGTPGGCLG
jgi:hypothetical protein